MKMNINKNLIIYHLKVFTIIMLLLTMYSNNIFAGTVLKNRGNNSVEQETEYVDEEDDDEVVDGEKAKKRTIGTQLYDVKYYDQLDGKNSVYVAGGGGGSGSGGGAQKKSGGTAGSNTTLKDSGKKFKINNINTSVEKSDKSDSINETMGFAKDDGEFHAEKKGEHAGKKVFEIDRNGNLGINDRLGILDARKLFGFALFLSFGVGAAVFLLASRDKRSKSSYF